MPALDLVLPGDPATLTGGYLYDRRIAEGLTSVGWTPRVLPLPQDFPGASRDSLLTAERVLDAIPAGRIVVVDGLALADLAPALERHARRLALVALVHHPLADETGVDEALAERLRRAERRAWDAARGVIVTSRWTARRIAGDGFPAERLRVVEPGTDRVAPHGRRAEADDLPPPLGNDAGARHRPPLHAQGPRPAQRGRDEQTAAPPRLLCVATLTERKGHAVLLDALARLADRPWRLDCVGSTLRDPAAAADIRARIERHGLGERIVLHGEVSRGTLDAQYRNAVAFVLASYLEGYGMALADALAHGLPIVATSAGAIPETVGDAALLVPVGDVDALAAALARVLDDPALRARLAASARRRAAALPTWDDASARFAAAVAALSAIDGPTRG